MTLGSCYLHDHSSKSSVLCPRRTWQCNLNKLQDDLTRPHLLPSHRVLFSHPHLILRYIHITVYLYFTAKFWPCPPFLQSQIFLVQANKTCLLPASFPNSYGFLLTIDKDLLLDPMRDHLYLHHGPKTYSQSNLFHLIILVKHFRRLHRMPTLVHIPMDQMK